MTPRSKCAIVGCALATILVVVIVARTTTPKSDPGLMYAVEQQNKGTESAPSRSVIEKPIVDAVTPDTAPSNPISIRVEDAMSRTVAGASIALLEASDNRVRMLNTAGISPAAISNNDGIALISRPRVATVVCVEKGGMFGTVRIPDPSSSQDSYIVRLEDDCSVTITVITDTGVPPPPVEVMLCAVDQKAERGVRRILQMGITDNRGIAEMHGLGKWRSASARLENSWAIRCLVRFLGCQVFSDSIDITKNQRNIVQLIVPDVGTLAVHIALPYGSSTVKGTMEVRVHKEDSSTVWHEHCERRKLTLLGTEVLVNLPVVPNTTFDIQGTCNGQKYDRRGVDGPKYAGDVANVWFDQAGRATRVEWQMDIDVPVKVWLEKNEIIWSGRSEVEKRTHCITIPGRMLQASSDCSLHLLSEDKLSGKSIKLQWSDGGTVLLGHVDTHAAHITSFTVDDEKGKGISDCNISYVSICDKKLTVTNKGDGHYNIVSIEPLSGSVKVAAPGCETRVCSVDDLKRPIILRARYVLQIVCKNMAMSRFHTANIKVAECPAGAWRNPENIWSKEEDTVFSVSNWNGNVVRIASSLWDGEKLETCTAQGIHMMGSIGFPVSTAK